MNPARSLRRQWNEGAFAAPDGTRWRRISSRVRWLWRLVAVLWTLPVAAVGAWVVARTAGPLGAALWLAASGVACAMVWIFAELAYRVRGYVERDDDLVVVQGVFVRRLTVVPYSRMEFVDVTAGLLEQWWGIATVRLHTAAAATDAKIPGLMVEEAARLRDRLAVGGEPRQRPYPR